ncbi:PKD domain-containing protein [Neolewinella aurantiaca]|uniref:PKD domain-containing protein n=1 Tax=Neolewinella aurantiaca TaxID=2602767 RepID=A0A5C7FUW1_9BACT|nr:PKD domain-containing protein [Neolewinella aurantiaca]TXF90400.1 PKD domain-containing protein [Neolewinella aurantiaca]
MKIFVTGLFIMSFSFLFAQNTYHQVTELNSGQQWLRSAAAQASAPGTSLLIYQHGGASISTSGGNTGQVTNYNGAGHYDLNRVDRVNGDTVFLTLPIRHTYSFLHTQVVLFETSPTVSVNGDQVVSQPFDGALGGVAFIAAEERILFRPGASLDASDAGFRGGQGTESDSDCNRLTIASSLTYGPGNWRGSSRGEGIAGVPASQPFGRAAAANGGGGGNDHNAGGGGGGNVTEGGVGARNVVMGLFNNACRGNYPGLAGSGLDNDDQRVYFGGGGGAGHANNTTNAHGGNGGGLIVLWAPTIDFGASSTLTVNGQDGADVDGDGGGGGGAAGSILLIADTLVGSPDLSLRGGNGGDVTNQPSRCFGPGGGGGGGRLLNAARVTDDYSPDASLEGGEFGKRLTSNECGPNDEPGGVGEDGEEELIAPIIPSGGFVQNTDVLCGGEILLLTDASNGANSVEWEVTPQSSDLRVDVIGQSLRVITAPEAGGAFRAVQMLIVDGISFPGDTAYFTVSPSPSITSASVVNNGEMVTVTLQDAIGFDSIRYDFGDGYSVDTTVTSLSHVYDEIGDYQIFVTLLSENCGNEIVVSRPFIVREFAAVNTDLKFAEGCAPLTFTITDVSTGYYEDRRWNFPGGTPATSNAVQPTVTYSEPGEYDATLTLLGAFGPDTIRIVPVAVFAQPAADVSVSVDTSTATFTNNSTDATDYLWDFGDNNTSTEAEPVHTYEATGTYTVTLIADNSPCTDSIRFDVVIDVLSGLADLEQLGVRLYPNPTSGQLNLTGPATIFGVFDVSGRRVLEGGQRNTDLSHLPSGTYMVGVTAEGRTHWVRVIRR